MNTKLLIALSVGASLFAAPNPVSGANPNLVMAFTRAANDNGYVAWARTIPYGSRRAARTSPLPTASFR